MRYRTPVSGAVALLAAAFFFSPSLAGIRPAETPAPSAGARAPLAAMEPSPGALVPVRPAPLDPPPNPPLSASVDCFNFDTNGAVSGTYFIPPDPHCAAGPDHVVVIGNTIIEWRPKDPLPAAPDVQISLRAFFSALPGPPPGPGTTLGTFTFDPKVIYDQYRQRFVVIALELWDTAFGDPSDESRILVAVSKGTDPNLGWILHSIDAKTSIGGIDRWVDYPGLAVGEDAVYVTSNMFAFVAGGSAFGGVRLWIIDKVPTYAGPDNSIAFTVHDPYLAAGIATTTQPAHMFDVLPPGSNGLPLGTFLLSYSGLSDGVNEYIQVVEVTDPLGGGGGPFFAQQFLNFGNIDDTAFGLSDAAQFGIADLIEVNDRRALNAVYRARNIWTCAELRPVAGPDVGQTTAHWWRIDAGLNPVLVPTDQGNVGAEDLGAGTWTFYPSVMVDCELNMAIGFSASNQAFFAGAYYATRRFADPPGFIAPTDVLKPGVAPYKRYFNGPRNRWGDYSGLALCPLGEADFWVFNEYAGPQGTPGVGSMGPEDGRWFTAIGRFRIKQPTAAGETPVTTRLAQNAPNPFNPNTSIRFTLAAAGHARVEVFDAGGRHVRTLVDESRRAGDHEVTWNGRDARGHVLASGVYFCRLSSGNVMETRKMVLLK
ncbi:MAG TPA: FlgD immunoglobulin-like domain containing protein [Candidatus Krumholzibacteria bacterium]|nr:FlgD immunoglobulin-like domain containing protein [Candidatus Krumholzibacteria bacterium]